MANLEDMGFVKILEFKQIPCDVYFLPEKAVTLSIGFLNDTVWLKASKQMFIKALKRDGEGIYSKLQNITKFMEYLKNSVPEFQCITYFISEITPKIAEESFRALPKIKELLEEKDKLESSLKGERNEEKLKKALKLIREIGASDESLKLLEGSVKEKLEMIQKIKKIESQLETASSVINEWIEKGYAISLLWNFSTAIHICPKHALSSEIEKVLNEIEMMEKQSVRARAYQQGLWIEEVKDPFYVYYAEAVGFSHPKLLQTYDNLVMKKFAKEIEQWFSARPALPIRRVAYQEDSSTAVAEAMAAFLRQVKIVEVIPKKIKTKLFLEKVKKPVYFGYLQTKTPTGFESSSLPFMIGLDELRKHCLITGATGSGKTRIAQIIAETSCLHVPTIIIDPMGELTGMLKKNKGMEKELRKFGIHRPLAYSFAKVYTLDDVGIQFKANLLKKPDLQGDMLISDADSTALIISQLLGDERLRDVIRESLLEVWERGKEEFEEFIMTVKEKAEKKKTVVKLDRLIQYKPLMGGRFSIHDLVKEKLVIFDLSSMVFTDSQKIMVMWFILRELFNYFLAQPHSDELRALLICDEVHRFYQPDVPRNAAVVLENIVKQGRAKGLGVVMISQSIKDLGETLTQANLRILLKILEAEIQSPYGIKFGLELARSLHSLDSRERIGYVFHGSEEYWCKFRPTLSLPKGLESYEEIKRIAIPEKAVELFNRQIEQTVQTVREKEEKIGLKLSEDEVAVVKALKELHKKGLKPNKSQLQRQIGVGRGKIVDLINSLEKKGIVKVIELRKKGHPKIVELLLSN